MDFAQNLLACRFPSVGFGVQIAVGQVGFDMMDQCFEAGKAALADYLQGQFSKEALHQIEPRGTGRREMQVKVPVPRQPLPDALLLVRPVIVEYTL